MGVDRLGRFTLLGLAALLAPTLAGAVEFPCDLKKQKFLPKIVLSGEDHSSDLDATDMLLLKDQGASGKIFVGLEGVFPGEDVFLQTGYRPRWEGFQEKDSRIRGIDAPFHYGLTSLLLMNLQLVNLIDGSELAPDAHGPARFLASMMVRNPFVREAWTAGRKSFDAPADVLGVLDELARNPQAAHSETSLEPLRNFPPDRLLKLVRSVGRSYVQLAKSPKYSKLMGVPKTIDLAEAEFAGEGDIVEAMVELVVGWRNEGMAQNIAQLYCEALREKKDVYAVVGHLHVPGLRAILEQASQGKVRITERATSEKLKPLSASSAAQAGRDDACRKELNRDEAPLRARIREREAGRKWAARRASEPDVKKLVSFLEKEKKILPDSDKAQVRVVPKAWGVDIVVEYPEKDLPPLASHVLYEPLAGAAQIRDLVLSHHSGMPLKAQVGLRSSVSDDSRFTAVRFQILGPDASSQAPTFR